MPFHHIGRRPAAGRGTFQGPGTPRRDRRPENRTPAGPRIGAAEEAGPGADRLQGPQGPPDLGRRPPPLRAGFPAGGRGSGRGGGLRSVFVRSGPGDPGRPRGPDRGKPASQGLVGHRSPDRSIQPALFPGTSGDRIGAGPSHRKAVFPAHDRPGTVSSRSTTGTAM